MLSLTLEEDKGSKKTKNGIKEREWSENTEWRGRDRSKSKNIEAGRISRSHNKLYNFRYQTDIIINLEKIPFLPTASGGGGSSGVTQAPGCDQGMKTPSLFNLF